MNDSEFSAHYWKILSKVRAKALGMGLPEKDVDGVATWAIENAPGLWAEVCALDAEAEKIFGQDFDDYKKRVVALGKALLKIYDRMAGGEGAADNGERAVPYLSETAACACGRAMEVFRPVGSEPYKGPCFRCASSRAASPSVSGGAKTGEQGRLL